MVPSKIEPEPARACWERLPVVPPSHSAKRNCTVQRSLPDKGLELDCQQQISKRRTGRFKDVSHRPKLLIEYRQVRGSKSVQWMADTVTDSRVT
jgi:hypothetical protein